MPPRRILLIPRHPLWRANNVNLTRLRPAQKPSFPFDQPTTIMVGSLSLLRIFLFAIYAALDVVMVDMHASVLCVPVCPLDRPLDPRDEVKVAVERSRCRQFVAPEVCGWVAHTGTLRPGLVPTGAGQ